MVWQAIVTWAGRTLLVRLGVITAGVTAGVLSSSVTSGNFSSLFNKLGWGEITGKEILQSVEAHYNDNGMGDGERCEDVSNNKCEKGTKRISDNIGYYRGIYFAGFFELGLEWEYDGCDILSIDFLPSMLPRTYRAQSMKVVIDSVKASPHSGSPIVVLCEDCCHPAKIKIIVEFHVKTRGIIYDDISSGYFEFYIASNGTGFTKIKWDK